MTPLVGAKWRWWVVALLCLWLLIGMVREVRAAGLLGNIESLQGNFTQEIVNSKGDVTAKSLGVFALLKPHFFRWQIVEPGRQLLISDGTFFWQHDEDLETVIRRPLEGQLNSPLGVLLADEGVLEEHYNLARSPGALTLTPIESNAMFTSMKVSFIQEVPTEVIVTDNLDQRIRFTLTAAPSTLLSAADFVFIQPAGADITIVNPE